MRVLTLKEMELVSGGTGCGSKKASAPKNPCKGGKSSSGKCGGGSSSGSSSGTGGCGGTTTTTTTTTTTPNVQPA